MKEQLQELLKQYLEAFNMTIEEMNKLDLEEEEDDKKHTELFIQLCRYETLISDIEKELYKDERKTTEEENLAWLYEQETRE